MNRRSRTVEDGVQSITFCLIALAITAAALAAPLLAGRHPLAAVAIRSFFSTVCHQNPERSFWLAGSPVAVCVRCLGIYCGAALGSAWSAWLQPSERTARRLVLVAAMLTLADVITGALHLHGNLPLPRFLLGGCLGMAAALLLTSARAQIRHRTQDTNPPETWRRIADI